MRLAWWHRVGQEVICINAEPVPNPDHALRTLRAVYTINRVHIGESGDVFLSFAELPSSSPDTDFGLYEAEDFRPPHKTSIEVFERMLNATRVRLVA